MSIDLTTISTLSIEILVLVLCLFLSAYFSGAETALTALSESKARQLVEDGARLAQTLRLWLNRPNGVLTAILIGKNIVNTVVAATATLLANATFERPMMSIGIAVATVALLVFGEITPKTFAKHHAARLAPLLMPGVVLLYYLTSPAVWLFTRFSHTLVRVTGGSATRTGPFVTEEDIAYMIRLGHKEGVIEQQEGRMLASIFELGDTLVREVMVPRTEISALPVTANLDQVLDEARVQGHSRMPVFDENLDDVKGFFHTKDLLDVMPDRSRVFSLKEHLRPVLFVPELMRVSELLKLFQRRKTHLAVVVDEYGGTAGIVALEDVLEEIVGEIQDEYDEDEIAFRKLDENRYVADGRASLYELGEALTTSFPQDGGYETLGGFLIAACGRMPVRGDRVPFAGWTFTVKEADEKRVARIEIDRTAPGPGGEAAEAEAKERGEKHPAERDREELERDESERERTAVTEPPRSTSDG